VALSQLIGRNRTYIEDKLPGTPTGITRDYRVIVNYEWVFKYQ
jgi:hypothetical protein